MIHPSHLLLRRTSSTNPAKSCRSKGYQFHARSQSTVYPSVPTSTTRRTRNSSNSSTRSMWQVNHPHSQRNRGIMSFSRSWCMGRKPLWVVSARLWRLGTKIGVSTARSTLPGISKHWSSRSDTSVPPRSVFFSSSFILLVRVTFVLGYWETRHQGTKGR